MAEYLNRAVEARANRPDDRRRLVQALAASQGRGAGLGVLSGGQVGRGLQRGPNPVSMEADLEERARAEAYGRERDQVRDAQWATEMGLKDAKLRQDRLTAGSDELAKEVKDYSKRMEDLAPLEQAMSDINAMMAGYGDEDIPGVGRFEGGSGVLGKTMRLFQGDEAQKNYATVEGLLQSVRRNAIGSQQTRTELEKIEQRVGQSGWESEEVFRLAIDQIRRAMAEERGSIAAGYSPSAVELYERRRDPYSDRKTIATQQAAPQGGTGKYTIISVE